MTAFDYEIMYKRGEAIPHADALSRLNFNSDRLPNENRSFIHLVETDTINIDQFREETENDSILKAIIKRIKTNRWSNCSVAERPFKSNKDKLTVEKGIVCNGDLIVPPPTLRKRFIEAVHDDVHCGALQTRLRLRLEAWWPGYCNDVEKYVSRCQKCSEIKCPPERAVHTWPEESGPWKRVHIDHAIVPGVGLFLVMVDSYSGWPEVIKVKNREAVTVKEALRSVFSRNGVPETIVSDNAAEFCDSDFCKWLRNIGCKPLKTPPNHPQSNGIAEKMVGTVKMGLKAYNSNRCSLDGYLHRMLLSYRTIPHAGRHKSPSELMGRQIRAPLTFSYGTGEQLWYRATPNATPQQASFISQAGNNTAIVWREGRLGTLAHKDQLRSRNLKQDEASTYRYLGSDGVTLKDGGQPFPTKSPSDNDFPIMPDVKKNDEIHEEMLNPGGDDDGNNLRGDQALTLRRSSRMNKGVKPIRYRGM